MKLINALLFQPERFWRWVLGRLWHDRLAFQYERGMEDGLRIAFYRPELFDNLDAHEQEALFGITDAQRRALCQFRHRNNPRGWNRDRAEFEALLDQINQERGAM